MGRAIVAPAKANIREIVVDGEQALLFQPGDRGQLRDCLGRLLADPELRQRLSSGALALVAERQFFWEANAEAVLTGVELAEAGRNAAPADGGGDAT